MGESMTTPAPEGWQRIEADERQAALLEHLHPVVDLELADELYIAASEGTTGALFAGPGDQLRVRSIGNNVGRVENGRTGHSALVQLGQLAECGARPWSSGA